MKKIKARKGQKIAPGKQSNTVKGGVRKGEKKKKLISYWDVKRARPTYLGADE